jgi:hypothetical protein
MEKNFNEEKELLEPDLVEKKKPNEEAKRKRPGRPRKNPVKEPKPRFGISLKPKNSKNCVEFLYDNPCLFKKIWSFFKSMAIAKLQIIFRPDTVIFYGKDHLDKSRILVKIDPSKLHHYYCEGFLDIGIPCANANPYFVKVDKTYNSIIIRSKTNTSTENIRITYKTNMEIDEEHKFELIGSYDRLTPSLEKKFMSEDDYTIHFEIPYKYFKKTITDIKGTRPDKMTFIQEGPDEPFQFTYGKSNKVLSSHTIRNNKLVKFKSNLQKDETFRVEFQIDYIKPVSSALLSETIKIYAHEKKKLLFKSSMDNGTIEIRVLTDIVDIS